MSDESSTTSEVQGGDRGGQLPKFKGTGYSLWAATFITYLDDRNWYEALTYDEVTVLSEAKRKKNKGAYNRLMQAIEHPKSKQLVMKAKSDDRFPMGDAAWAWRLLKDKFEPKASINQQMMLAKLYHFKLVDLSQDPEEYIDELLTIQRRLKEMKVNVCDEQIICQVMHNLPSEYDMEVTVMLNDADLNLDKVSERLQNQYQRLKNHGTIPAEVGGSDTAMMAHGGKKFDRNCNYCGKQGHKSESCFLKQRHEDERTNNTKKQDGRSGSTNSNGNSNGSGGRYSGGGGNGHQPRSGSFPFRCYNCGKNGHRAFECTKKGDSDDGDKSDKAEIVLSALGEELALSAGEAPDDNLWIGDTGASSHMKGTLKGMTDLVDASPNDKIIFGNNARLQTAKIGKWHGIVKYADGSQATLTLDNVKYIPGLAYNLFSLTAAMDRGAQLHNKGKVLCLTKGSLKLFFDEEIKTRSGFILGIKMESLVNDVASAGLQEGTKVKASTLHGMLGHCNDSYMRKTAKDMGIEITGKLETCESCAIGKASQKAVPKQVVFREDRAPTPGSLMYVDITSVRTPSYGSKQYWILMVDDKTDFCISKFVQRKSSLKIVGLRALQDLAAKGINVKTIRCDNAGENRHFEMACQDAGLKVQFEYTAPGTPQQNGKVERKFATLSGMLRSMLTGAQFDKKTRTLMWAECANTATDLHNITLKLDSPASPHQQFFGVEAAYARNLRTFGEIGVAKEHNTVKAKLDDRGTTCVFVGYAAQHAGDVYRMLSLTTQKLRLSRDVRWLGTQYGQYKKSQPTARYLVNGEADDYDEDDNHIPNESDNEKTDEEPDPAPPEEATVPLAPPARVNIFANVEPTRGTRSGRIFNPQDEDETEEQEVEEQEELAEIALIEATTDDGKIDDPRTFQEAWHHPDTEEREGWRKGIKKEFKDMITRGVWRKVKKKDIPNNRRLIGNKWVFRKKKDGRYRARLCALGYSQIPGEDFTDIHSPVVTDVTFRTVLVLAIQNNWRVEIVDITTAFLYGDMEEQVFMTMPHGLDVVDENGGWDSQVDATELLQTIYGTKQASRQFWKKLMKVLKEIEKFATTHADPCLLIRITGVGVVLICAYVDDLLIAGDSDAVEEVMNAIDTHFETRRLGPLDEYIGCTVKKHDDGSCTLLQPDMVKKIVKEFGAEAATMRNTETPMGSPVIRPDENDDLLNKEDQTRYRSGVGMLLYLVKHSRPDLNNAVRELSKVMDGATADHMKMMLRTVRFVMKTKNRGLHMKPTRDYTLEAYVDSDFAGDQGTRKSITGYLVYFCGVVVAWKSKQQGGVTLSSSEAEYYALSEVATELLFVKQIVEFLGVPLQLPMVVHVDNNGAIYLANNSISGTRTKHIDTRVHFVRDLTQAEPPVLKTIFVRTEDNQADTFTKNVSNDLFWRLTSKYMTMEDDVGGTDKKDGTASG